MSSSLEKYIFPAIDAFSFSFSPDEVPAKSASAPLFGSTGAPFDEDELSRFLLIIEDRVYQDTGVLLSLSTCATNKPATPVFETLGAFSDYLDDIIDDKLGLGKIE